jgi:hypothetical protein
VYIPNSNKFRMNMHNNSTDAFVEEHTLLSVVISTMFGLFFVAFMLYVWYIDMKYPYRDSFVEEIMEEKGRRSVERHNQLARLKQKML